MRPPLGLLRFRFVSLVTLVGLGAPTCTREESRKIVLRVALYPYFDDAGGDSFRGLTARIKKEFEAQHPDVDLVLRKIDPAEKGFYELDTLKTWLGAHDGGSYDVVEIDAVLLGDLVATGTVGPWPGMPKGDWSPVATRAAVWQDTLYAVPHWLCGYFLFTRDSSVARAGSAPELAAALRKSTHVTTPSLAGDLDGNWVLPTLYLDALAETRGAESVSDRPPAALDTEVVRVLGEIFAQCRVGTNNPCVGAFHDNDSAAVLFGRAKVNALIGYSERLHVVRRFARSADRVSVRSAPLGLGGRPAWFVDVFMRRRECNAACLEAAKAFVDYMDQPATFEWILLSRDGPNGTPPRYLIPATTSARTPSVMADPGFQAILAEVRDGPLFPRVGLHRAIEDLRAELKMKLGLR